MNSLVRSAVAAAALLSTCVSANALAGEGDKVGAPLALPLDGTNTAPDWRSLPSGEDLEREYPPLAQVMQLAGSATITCNVKIDGRVDECHVVSETPQGLGFGAAAVRSAAYFTMRPATHDGIPVQGVVTIPLKFQLANATPLPAEPPPPPTSPGALEVARQVVALEGLADRLRTQWRVYLDQMAARVVLSGDTQAGTAGLDAFRQGLEETIAGEVDRRARFVAARMSEAELRATVAYLETPAGKAWMKANAAGPQDFMQRLAAAARTHLCAQTACGASAPAATGSR